MNYLVRRFFSFYIDMVFISIISIIVYIIIQLLSGISFTMIRNPLKENLVIIQLFIFLFYFIFLEYLFSCTLGKKLLKFKIVGLQSNKKTRFKQVLIRNLVKLIPIEPFSIFLDEKYCMWHDSISKTTVIDEREKK